MPLETNPDDLMTTGQVARILGTTVRHVVNLCLRGELPYSMVGTHRRNNLLGDAGKSGFYL